MAESRVRALSMILWVALAGSAAALTANLVAEGFGVGRVVVAALAITAAQLLSVPTPSGKRISLGIGPAVAASILLQDATAIAAAYAGGLALAWVAMLVRHRRSRRDQGEFLTDALSMIVYAVAVVAVADAAAESALNTEWQVLLAVAAGGIGWFVVRAVVSALVGLERRDVSSRYLWLLALEDWAVAVSIFSAGALFGLAWPVMGAWAIPIAVLPYAFSHLAFERYHSTKLTYGQTIRALAQIPEVADLAPRGHSTRTADLAVAVAREIGLHPTEVTELEYAALMHDVGRITLSEPAILKAGYTDEDIARWGAQIIAEAPYLEHVAELVEKQHEPYRRPGVERDPDVPAVSKIIKVASAYDQSVEELGMDPVEALDRLHRGSAYDFDPLVSASLRRVLVHRGIVAV